MPGLLLDTLNGKRADRVPLWLMRQAGRYLPEYRALREQKGGFLAMAYDSEAACEITLQPIDRFGFDGAILFSDILTIPDAMPPLRRAATTHCCSTAKGGSPRPRRPTC